MASAKDIVDGKIAAKKVMVFSKTYCPFCKKARDILKKYVPGILNDSNFEIFEMENDPKCQEIQDYLKEITGGRSVPRVFIGGKCVGGGDETAALERSNKLEGMLKAACS